MNEADVIRWDAPGPYDVAFSTRRGGVSEGPYASLNLGLKTGDDPERIQENRSRACAETGSDLERLALGFQHHSATVNRASPGLRGVPGDGLWTDEPGIPLLAIVADCLPIAVVRRNGATPALAVLHAGWIGMLAGLIEAGVAALGEGRTAAVVGPAIGPCCYEVGEEVAAPYRARFGRDVMRRKRLDLRTAAGRALGEAGVTSVEHVDLCTACNPELFFSHRRDGKPRGVQGIIGRIR